MQKNTRFISDRLNDPLNGRVGLKYAGAEVKNRMLFDGFFKICNNDVLVSNTFDKSLNFSWVKILIKELVHRMQVDE